MGTRSREHILNAEPLRSRDLWLNVAVWVLFSLLAVALRGARWDEAFERAQVILELTRYPHSHPLFQYAHGAFTIHYYAAALLLHLTRSASVVCGLRNVLFLLATILPTFLLVAHITRRARWGHVAAALTLLGAHVAFAPYYPLFVWPERFSSGHIGMAYAFVILFLLLRERLSPALFLLGLMPIIHLGQMPVILVFAFLYLVWWTWKSEENSTLARALAWGAAGLTLCGLFWVVQHALAPHPATQGSYASNADAHAIWMRYVLSDDVHRAFPRWNPIGHCIALVAGTLLLGVGAAWYERSRPACERPRIWLLAYALCATLLAWLPMLAFAALNEKTPPALIIWMPQRLTNHVVLVFVVLAFAQLVQEGKRMHAGRALMAAVFAYCALRPLLACVVPEALYTRYLGLPEAPLCILAGAALAHQGLRLLDDVLWMRAWLAAVAAGLISFALYAQFLALCVFFGMAGFLALAWIDRCRANAIASAARHATIATLAALCVAIVLYAQWRDRERLPREPFDVSVADYLAEAGQPHAMLAVPHFQIDLQERLGHPVTATYETPQLMCYMPQLAAGIQQLYADLYGVCFGEPWDYRLDAWVERSLDEWRRLADVYGFRYVWCPNAYELTLPTALAGESVTLYKVAR